MSQLSISLFGLLDIRWNLKLHFHLIWNVQTMTVTSGNPTHLLSLNIFTFVSLLPFLVSCKNVVDNTDLAISWCLMGRRWMLSKLQSESIFLCCHGAANYFPTNQRALFYAANHFQQMCSYHFCNFLEGRLVTIIILPSEKFEAHMWIWNGPFLILLTILILPSEMLEAEMWI